MRHLLLAALLLAAPAARADALDNVWLDALRDQLWEEKVCDVAYFVNVRTYDLGSGLVNEARANCIDRRQFDAVRAQGDESFTIEECGVQICSRGGDSLDGDGRTQDGGKA